MNIFEVFGGKNDDFYGTTVSSTTEVVPLLGVFHLGYLDHYILNHSTLLNDRCLEIQVLTDSATKDILVSAEVSVIYYREL